MCASASCRWWRREWLCWARCGKSPVWRAIEMIPSERAMTAPERLVTERRLALLMRRAILWLVGWVVALLRGLCRRVTLLVLRLVWSKPMGRRSGGRQRARESVYENVPLMATILLLSTPTASAIRRLCLRGMLVRRRVREIPSIHWRTRGSTMRRVVHIFAPLCYPIGTLLVWTTADD